MSAGLADAEPVEVKGVITDVFDDEIDARYTFLLLKSENAQITIPIVHDIMPTSRRELLDLLDAEVAVIGICVIRHGGLRHTATRRLYIDSISDIRRIGKTPHDPFAASQSLPPVLGETQIRETFPHRYRTTGTVTAIRNDRSFFLRTDDGRRLHVRLSEGEPAPHPGDHAAVAGFLFCGPFFIHFNNAVIRPSDGPRRALDTPEITSAATVLFDENGRFRIDPQLDGDIIRLAGTVKDMSGIGTERGTLAIDSDGITVPVEIGIREAPDLGSRIEVTGVCAITSDGEDRGNGFVRLNGFAVVTRAPSDIRVLARPPWWTVGRLFAAVCVLVALLLAIFIWNRILRRIVERRSRELLKEQIAGVTAALKADERARLSVELHDSFSQNLTGISFRIDAAAKAAKVKPEIAEQHLDTAKRMLLSCREELRDCINDLRNDLYGEEDVAEAIRKTVLRHIGDCALEVDCPVPRNRLSDMTMHTLLMIVRELSANAVRHGHATAISVSARLDAGGLHVSVSDNGGGFDPENRPGTADGHFGLQGIADRLALVEGTLDCEAAPGKGARFTIFIPERKTP